MERVTPLLRSLWLGILRIWRSGRAGKIGVSIGALLLFSCCASPFTNANRSAAPTATAVAAASAATSAPEEASPSSVPTIESTEAPTNTPAPTLSPTPEVTDTPTTVPTDAPPTDVPPTAAPVEREPSRGLGMSRTAWEAREGKSTKKEYVGERYGNDVLVYYIDERVEGIELQYADFNAMSPTDAKQLAELYLPEDRKLIETYTARDITAVHLYYSEWLKDRFPADTFIGGEPGQFIVLYTPIDGKVTRIIMGTGNNP